MHMSSSMVALFAAAQVAVASPLSGYYSWNGLYTAPSAAVTFTAPTGTSISFPTGTSYPKVKRHGTVEEREFSGFYPTGTAPIFPTGTSFPTGSYAKEKRQFPTGTGTGSFPTASGWVWPMLA